MSRPSAKESLLDAAEAVVVREGPGRLTLDAVAAEAKVSKGGLLYHFPAKEALLEAMITRLLDRASAQIAAYEATLSPDVSGALSAELQVILNRTEADRRVGAALLAAVANEPKLLSPVKEFQRRRFARLAEGVSSETFAHRALVLLAAEGLHFLELLQLTPFTPAQRKALSAALMGMPEGMGETAPGSPERSRK